jgi:nucleoside-diphosphate-sugar epimerase
VGGNQVKFTVLGGQGFIGSNVVRYLRESKDQVYVPQRGDQSILNEALGHVIYCIGLTADFRQRTHDTVRAHVCYLSEILEKAHFDSLLYLSSTRVYANMSSASEDQKLIVNPQDSDDLYNLSKLLGESLCFSSGRPNVRVVRLSNVCGVDFSNPMFIFSIIRDAVDKKKVVLSVSLDSEKDYVSIDDVVKLVREIATRGRHRLYNIASGVNTTNRDLLRSIQSITGCALEVSENAEKKVYPKISISRIREEFHFSPASLSDVIAAMVYAHKSASTSTRGG